MRMTAESGETLCAWRKTSMPSMLGILISVMMTSYSAPSILFLAFCPAWTVSTRCPSRRREISSISQMERSSSQTRMLATRTSSRRCSRRLGDRQHVRFIACSVAGSHGVFRVQAAESQDKCRALARLRSGPYFPVVSLYDLVNDRQPQPGASFKVGLEGFEDFFDLLRRHAHSGVHERDLPVIAQGLDCGGQRASIFHGAYGILTKIPEDLLQLVAVGDHPGFGNETPLDRDPGFFGRHAMVHQGQRVFHEANQVDSVELKFLGSRIGEEIGDDGIQPLGLAGHDVEQAAVILVHLRKAGEHADRAGD